MKLPENLFDCIMGCSDKEKALFAKQFAEQEREEKKKKKKKLKEEEKASKKEKKSVSILDLTWLPFTDMRGI